MFGVVVYWSWPWVMLIAMVAMVFGFRLEVEFCHGVLEEFWLEVENERVYKDCILQFFWVFKVI